MDQNIHIMTHPLIQHKLALIRNKDASGKEFRETVSEIATLLCYDAARDLRTREVEVETPITTAHCHVLADKIAIVPILRAGLGMVEGVENLIPTARRRWSRSSTTASSPSTSISIRCLCWIRCWPPAAAPRRPSAF